ncbi:hypothetical protein E4631_21720 [Hymenobacter sp. UV11]|uniref:gliding motility protein GldB-related protein n=1 Tax=Hymenobacter sp. UV11 TaxID=1849735 RepID=UPI00105CBBED|nr:DUF2268 domain-containing putative Zn-dependent protease [Hymenobacter sp. UV11]TDN36791.1 hypothetical protein A8B98_07310 [Hymenobacter sp. UV11]TFZ63675.1 hypothetical protein E4631_21720 [Hymenobacter sp. UV11]
MQKVTRWLLAGASLIAFTLVALPELIWRVRLATAQPDPQKVQLVTEDIPRFWRAYDLAARDTAHAVQLFQRVYFDQASPGLRDYFDLKIKSVPKFVANQRRKARYYRSIRSLTLRVDSLKPQILAGFGKLKELYPAARFPNVYFVIGRWTSGGTASRRGLLIGTDMACQAPGIDEGELTLWERHNLGSLAGLPSLVAHEHIHFLQKDGLDRSLLRGAIHEGMADFLAELATGRNVNARLQAYGLAHEPALWAAFTQEMGSTNSRNWIANDNQETADKPADLGYFVGYRICQAYYERLADKKQAVADMLTVSDYPAFLAKSGYAQKMAAQ